eukprot:706540-Amphidinium_carterae.2
MYQELDAALAYYDKLKPSCVDAGTSYDDRVSRRKDLHAGFCHWDLECSPTVVDMVDKRKLYYLSLSQEEIESLQEALRILNGDS